LTESVFAGDQASINPILTSLREKGVAISLDDFGTGFSCLAYLRSMPIDMIKIDRSFVEAVNVDSAPIIQTIVATAKTFGLKTVAEGVETRRQGACLIDLGADFLQGFLFSGGISPQLMRAGFQQTFMDQGERNLGRVNLDNGAARGRN
jgi:sensor c-di-GMP phosphodiesterase-like protein